MPWCNSKDHKATPRLPCNCGLNGAPRVGDAPNASQAFRGLTHCGRCGQEITYHHAKVCEFSKRCQYVHDADARRCGNLAYFIVITRSNMGACSSCLAKARAAGDVDEVLARDVWLAQQCPDEVAAPMPGKACVACGEDMDHDRGCPRRDEPLPGGR